MRLMFILVFVLLNSLCFSQENDWVKTEGTITEITIHRSKRIRETAMVKFTLESGEEQLGNVELFRIPFLGSMKKVGDTITINYNKNNPVLLETMIGNLLSKYGIYILILLGVVFSIKPFLKLKNN